MRIAALKHGVVSICSLEHCWISRNGIADNRAWASGPTLVPVPFYIATAYPRRCRTLASPMSTQTALCDPVHDCGGMDPAAESRVPVLLGLHA